MKKGSYYYIEFLNRHFNGKYKVISKDSKGVIFLRNLKDGSDTVIIFKKCMKKKKKKTADVYVSKILVEFIKNSPQRKLFRKVIKKMQNKLRLKIKCMIMMKKKKK